MYKFFDSSYRWGMAMACLAETMHGGLVPEGHATVSK
jgi:hypothetical protein